MTGDHPAPSQLAHFDQAWAELNCRLNELISVHREALFESDSAREIDIVGLGRLLLTITDHEGCAELLACAVDRLLTAEATS